MVATVLAAAAIGANAEEFALKPAQKGMEINLPVTILKSFPNDKASITLSAMSEAKDLATAQSEVNKTLKTFPRWQNSATAATTPSRFIQIRKKARHL